MKKRTLETIICLPLVVILCSCNSHSSSADDKNSNATNLFAFLSTNTPPGNSSRPFPNDLPDHPNFSVVAASPDDQLLTEAEKLCDGGNLAEALDKVAEVLKADPKNVNGYLICGQIYSQMKKWPEAKEAFQAILAFNANSAPAQFNLSELQFMQKQYDAARPGFQALEKNSDLGDFASYKVFLCDLMGGHEDQARKDLDAFNANGSDASYYFSNAAWDLYHNEPRDALVWLREAQQIFYPIKLQRYASSLRDLGYLPLPVSLKSP